MSCPSKRWDLRPKMEHLSNSMLHFYQNPHQNKPSTTGKTLGSLNKTNPTLSGMRYVGYKTASPTSASWNPLQPHQKYKTFALPPKPETAVQHTSGNKKPASTWGFCMEEEKEESQVIFQSDYWGLKQRLSLPSLPCQVPEHKKDQDKLNHI